MKRILLTGASGFIGRHCIAPLREAGYEVHGVGRRSRPSCAGELRWHGVDLLAGRSELEDLLSAVEPTHLLHLAWYVVPGGVYRSPENVRWLESSLALSRVFAERGGERMLLAGSCYEYDWGEGLLSERSPRRPDTLYGVCKNALGDVISARPFGRPPSAAWARIFFVYGPYEHPTRLVPAVVRALVAKEPALCTHGRQVRDYLFVQDVADALVAVLDSNVEGPVNIGSGRGVKLGEIVGRIGNKLGHPELVRLGALPARANEADRVVAETRRLREQVGWCPKVSLEEGLERTIRWWRTEAACGPEVAAG